jgi:hypothetical protein
MRRLLLLFSAVALLAAGCTPLLQTPGKTAGIELVSTTNVNGWTYDFYRNTDYPCSVSGYHTFVVGTKDGSDAGAPAPLWVFMHGGGAGYFDANGNPVPGANQKVEEDAGSLVTHLQNRGLVGRLRDDAAGFRMLAVSYCSHDVYGGAGTPDPHNPNTTPDGQPRLTEGLYATKAAVQFARAKYPTTKFFLHGTSAGSVGTFGVAWALQVQGIPPAGIVADASIVNVEAFEAGYAAGICVAGNAPERLSGVAARVHPQLAASANEPDRLVANGRLTVPIMHIWNHGDVNTCGSLPVMCPLRDGSTTTLGITDCIHEPMRRVIAAQGPSSRSVNLPVCVDTDGTNDCSTHVVTTRPRARNTDPSSPADYLTAIVTWVHARLAD